MTDSRQLQLNAERAYASMLHAELKHVRAKLTDVRTWFVLSAMLNAAWLFHAVITLTKGY